ncbi:MAG TPA: polyprenyl synthetase family protein, partial [Promineifilum sp.]|nr:polyprenyl synthetase family protein [Promineifilum sp.]
IDRETYKRIVALKTASLFEASARMGALIGGGTPEEVDALANYAYNLGIAFQVVDDILDVIGDPEALGKPVGTDLSQGRGAFVAQGERAILSLQPAIVEEDDPIKNMMAKLRTSGAIEMAQRQAVEMVERARRALEPIGPSPARDELEALTNLVLERDR